MYSRFVRLLIEVINQPAQAGFFMYGAPGEFGSNACSKKSPGAIFHDRREPEGQPTWM